MNITKIGVHHFAGDYTLSQVNNSHKQRWPDFPSKLRPDLYIGYTIIIWKDGSWLQTRFIGEETAAAKGANLEAIHIALDGNFSVIKPTWAQRETLKRMLIQLVNNTLSEFRVLPNTTVKVSKESIFPHRKMGVTITDCYGALLPDDWAKVATFGVEPIKPLPIVSEGPELTRLQKIVEVLKQLIETYILMNKVKLGTVYRGCGGDMRG